MKITLVGFGMSNKALLDRLGRVEGYEFFLSERRPLGKDEIDYLNSMGIEYEVGHTERLLDADVIVVSPGVKPSTEVGNMILSSGVQVHVDVSFYFEIFEKGRAKVIGVTGTNGKSTTVYMIEHVLRKLSNNAVAAGNNEFPIFRVDIDDVDYLVLELSSFQLFWSPHIPLDYSLILNVKEDHLDWHGSFQDYLKSKLKVLDFSKESILNPDLSRVVQKGKYRVFSGVDEKKLPDPLRSAQNVENVSAVKTLLVDVMAVVGEMEFYDLIGDFELLPHRLEFVDEVKGVKFYDDSKATNTHAVLKALSNFEAATLILSGIVKEKNLEDFAKAVEERTDVVILLGEEIRRKLGSFLEGHIFVSDMKSAVEEAFRRTKSGVVLFSPAGASFDMYKNYKERGEDFKRKVGDLKRCIEAGCFS